jgi:hypothetical protein
MRNMGHGRGAHPPLQRASPLDGDADDARRAPPASTARPLRVRLLPPPPLPTRFSGEGELSPASLDAGGSGTLAGGSSSCRRSRSSLCIFPSSSSLPCSTSRSAVVTCLLPRGSGDHLQVGGQVPCSASLPGGTTRFLRLPAEPTAATRCTKGCTTLLELLLFCSTDVFSLVCAYQLFAYVDLLNCWSRS